MKEKKDKLYSAIYEPSNRLKIVDVTDKIKASSYLMHSILSKVEKDYVHLVDFFHLDSEQASSLFNWTDMYEAPVCLYIMNGEIVEIFQGLVPGYRLTRSIHKYVIDA